MSHEGEKAGDVERSHAIQDVARSCFHKPERTYLREDLPIGTSCCRDGNSTNLQLHSMANHALRFLTISVALRFCSVNDSSHFLFLFVRQIDIPGGPVLFQSSHFSCPRNGNHALSCDPRKGNLSESASSTYSKLLNLLDDGFVFVEVLSLELGD